ncbi:MAG: hypothetical protein IPO25_15885 [Saprospiraceae bacterium]|nr:hypothetical protein [Saprospiraceae bacterium]
MTKIKAVRNASFLLLALQSQTTRQSKRISASKNPAVGTRGIPSNFGTKANMGLK